VREDGCFVMFKGRLHECQGRMGRTRVQIGVYPTRSAVKGALTQYVAALKPYLTEAFHLELIEVRGADESSPLFKASDLGFPPRKGQ
jgi:hypothetical protein